jgi:hypothetical protein
VPYSLVENPEFRELFLELEPRYVVPGRNTITKEMLNVIAIMKTNIQEAIFLAKTIHLCCIIWSKKGMTESFLGVVAHFFAKNERHKATLAVRNIFGSHTGNNILGVMEQVLSEWNINKQAVGKVLTDNGSNIIKAFRDFQSSEIDDESVYDYMKDKSYVDLEDNECTTGADDATHTDNSDEDVDDETENRAKCNDTTIHVTSREIDEYDEHERDHNDVFSYNDYERLPCFPHTLQLVVSKFDEVKSCKDAICTAKKITARINKSVKATEMLRNLAGKKLLSDCPTRWSSTFLLLERLLNVRDHLETVLKELNWDGLQLRQWKTIENVVDLLRPFAEYTDLSGGEEYTTISGIIPILMELSLHLQKVSIATLHTA